MVVPRRQNRDYGLRVLGSVQMPCFCCFLKDNSEIVLVSSVFGMMMLILLHLCLGEDFRAQHISGCSFTVHVRREESQVFFFYARKELTCPRSPSSEYRYKEV